jgi:homoserine O-acetyltransferase/O-succinyltransferase
MKPRTARSLHTPAFILESGERLSDLVQHYHLDGALNHRRDNLILVFHALTGSADAVGDWWAGVEGTGPPGALGGGGHAVLSLNLLGSCYGTRWGGEASRRPRITTRDMAAAVRLVVEDLGVSSVALAVGGSLGGMVALEWALCFPALTRNTVAIAAPAAQTASAIGWNAIQRAAIGIGGPDRGLALARQIGMMTYRTGGELDARFGRGRAAGTFQVERYLRHHGQKLVGRFDTRSYLTLLDAMDSHDVGRGRGGADAALRGTGGRLAGVAIPGDLLYPADQIRRWTDAAGAPCREIHSIHGHDAFLIEVDQVNSILAGELAKANAPAAAVHTGTI